MMSRKHRDPLTDPVKASSAALLVRPGRIIALASVLAVAPMVTGFPQVSAPARPHPVTAHVHTVGFVRSSVAALRTARNATGSVVRAPGAPDPVSTARAAAVTPVQDVAGPVTVVGVTWPRGAVSAHGQFQIRTLSGSTWSLWQPMKVIDGGGDSTAAVPAIGGTDPYVVTGASRYEVRSLTTDAAVPTGATVDAVDPGTSSADSAQPALGAASAATAMPAIHTRADWGANESAMTWPPSYGTISVGFVHHTDGSNNYTAAQVPAMIRAIYGYHAQTLHWGDIGYNFLVDRFGGIWEGRYGGMSRPVIGGQVYNYNSVSTGVSGLGTFTSAAVPQVMTNAFARILAWKLSVAGIPATGASPVRAPSGTYIQRISGHRDVGGTTCPGNSLYARLPEIRAGAAALIAAQQPSIIRSVITRDVDRNGAPDVLSYSPDASGTGPISVLASASRTPVRKGVAIGTGWNVLRNASLSPDLSGDGKPDIVAQDPAGNRLRIYLGNGRGGFAGMRYLGRGWNVMTRVIPAGDRSADGRNDLLAVKTTGDLIYYPGKGAGSVYPGRLIGRGWNIFSSITSAGDLNGDRLPDLLATRKSDGVQVMYAGAPGGSVRPGVIWGTGWGSFSPVVGGSDLDGDQYPDLYARSGGGMSTYSSDASGRFVRYTRWGAGWGGFTQISTGADCNGDRVADLFAVNPASKSGTLVLYAGIGERDFRTRVAAVPAVPGADLVRLVGDVDGDGYTDAVARVRTNNTLVLLRGTSVGGFAAPVAIGAAWNAFTLVEPAGDVNADGVPDLLAVTAAGDLLLYPMTRAFGFTPRVSIGIGFQGMLSVVGSGAFDSDAYGDVIALRASDHALLLFRGTGPHALQSPTVLANAQVDLVQVLGVGDYNGDGAADLMARASDGRLWLYPGNGRGGVAGRQPVRGGEGVGHVIG